MSINGMVSRCSLKGMKCLRLSWIFGVLVCCAAAQGQGALIPAAFYAVQGAPFTLTVETHWDQMREGGPKQGTQRILRDAAGRQRYDTPVLDGVPSSAAVRIYDVVDAKFIKLDMNAKTAEVAPMRVGRPVRLEVSTATSLPPSAAEADQALLGIRDIAGLEAWGQRTVRDVTLSGGKTMPQDRESWLSTHYRMPLMQVVRSERGKTTQTVVSFLAEEPDPALFQIPAGFTVHDAPPPPEPAPGTVRIGGDVSAPVLLKSVDPEFSEEARRKQISGSVLVHLIVDEQGLPQDVKVTRSLGSGLDEKAVQAVSRYRFKPAMREGMPVKVELNVAIDFRIFSRP